MPRFNDHIYLYKESKIISYVWTSALFCYAFCNLIVFIMGAHLITVFLIQCCGLIAVFSPPFISTFWVLQQIKVSQQKDSNIPVQSENHSLQIYDILQDKELIDLFMQHLIEEFSMECLLSVIEFQQFKSYSMQQLNINTTDMGDAIKTVIFPDNVPQSNIVYNDHGEETEGEGDMLLLFKIKAYKLYEKYIKIGTEFEINISYRTRGTLQYLMKDYDQWISDQNRIDSLDLVKIFESAETEMIKLLNHSKYRFKFEKL